MKKLLIIGSLLIALGLVSGCASTSTSRHDERSTFNHALQTGTIHQTPGPINPVR